MMIFLYFLVLMPLIARQTSGLPGKGCGGVVCLDSNDVTCIAEKNQCKCNNGLQGNGRFACVDAVKSCVCYLYGDPYVTGFSTSVMSINLPCQHILTEFTTPDGIQVRVTAMAGQRNERNYPGYVFENELLFEAAKGTTFASANFRRDGFYNKGLKVDVPITAQFPEFFVFCNNDEHDYWRLELPGKGIVVRYRDGDSSVTIEAPRKSQFVSRRPCGQCAGDGNSYKRAAQQLDANIHQWSLINVFNNLDTQRETDRVCKSLGSTYTGCPENQRVKAVKFCGAPFSNSEIGKCFSQKFGKAAVLGMVQKCMESYCRGAFLGWCQTTRDAKATCDNTQVNFNEILSSC